MSQKDRSKLLSLVLRHEPEKIGIELDDGGWTSVEGLVDALASHGQPITRADLVEIVRTSDKQRFAISEDGARIRANQGHSVEVDLGYEPAAPPSMLFHGTVAKFVDSIRAEGLSRQARHHVHLSATRDTAVAVASRRGRPVVLEVRAKEMVADGHAFFVSANGVWLTEAVPASYLVFPTE